MGKHHESDRAIDLIRTEKFRRVLIAGCLAALAFFAFGFQPLMSVPAGNVDGTVAQGVVGPTALGSLTPPEAETMVLDPTQAPPEQTPGTPMVFFDRAMVRTVSKDGSTGLTVASAGLSRPPAGSLYAPLEVLNPSSPYGYRYSPLTGLAGEFHWGQDYAAACGTRVYAADAGVVRAVGWHIWGGGNRVEIEHGNGLVTTYNHLQAIGVTQGQSVRVGEVIAEVGTTGWSTGCHLHFETIVNGLHTNPNGWTYLPIKQVDPLQTMTFVNYQPGVGTGASAPQWAVPVADGTNRAVIGGEHEEPVAPPVVVPPVTSVNPPGPVVTSPTQTTTPVPSPSVTATQTAPATPTVTPTPTATPTPTVTPTPTITPTPTDTPTSPPAVPETTTAPVAPTDPVSTVQAPTVQSAVAPPPAAVVEPPAPPAPAVVEPAPAPPAPAPAVVEPAPAVAPIVPTVTQAVAPAPTPVAPAPAPTPVAVLPSALPVVTLPPGYILIAPDLVQRPDGVIVPLSTLVIPAP
ncbi:M23 family metallopeptidase [Paenarthrobacter sp. CC6]|uniref:M23 family metallopeptidase n=1 Tax=Paenarthrobacter sp. CC6 TaxID=3029184 RepID=UPI00339C77EC